MPRGTDRIVFGREGTLWQVLASGGAAKQITTPDKDQHEIAQALPMVMPGSAILLFSCWTERSVGPVHIEALSLDTGKRRVVVE